MGSGLRGRGVGGGREGMCNVRVGVGGSVGCSGITWSNRNGHFDVLAKKEITAKRTEQSKNNAAVFILWRLPLNGLSALNKKKGGGVF